MERLSLGNDPAVLAAWEPIGKREERHKTRVVSPDTSRPAAPPSASRRRRKSTKKKGATKRAVREVVEDESQNETRETPSKKASTAAPPPAVDTGNVQEVGQQIGHQLAQALHGASIGTLKISIKIVPK